MSLDLSKRGEVRGGGVDIKLLSIKKVTITIGIYFKECTLWILNIASSFLCL